MCIRDRNLRAKRNKNKNLSDFSKLPVVGKPLYPALHFPKGFERFSGLNKVHLTSPIRHEERKGGKLPSLSKIPSHQSFARDMPDGSIMGTLALSPSHGGTLLKAPLDLARTSKMDKKLHSIEKYGLGEGIKSLSLLKSERDLSLKKMLDVPRRSTTQLQPLENIPPKPEIEEGEDAPIVFSREFGGSLSKADLEKKMNDKDYLTPLDFIAC